MLKKLPCWIPDFFAGRDLAAAELHLLQALYVLVTTVKHFHFTRRDISKECLEASLKVLDIWLIHVHS